MKRRRRKSGRGERGPQVPASSTEQLLKEFVSWLTEVEGPLARRGGGVPVGDRRLPARLALSDLTTATTEDIERYLDETNQEDLMRRAPP
jgi:hypothetical protein